MERIGNPELCRNSPVESVCVLPVLALNEIYIGESLSSRVSYLEVQVWTEKGLRTRIRMIPQPSLTPIRIMIVLGPTLRCAVQVPVPVIREDT